MSARAVLLLVLVVGAVPVAAAQSANPPTSTGAERPRPACVVPRTALVDAWSLDRCVNDEPFELTYHQPMYFIGRWSDDPNHQPTPADPEDTAHLDSVEAKFQLSAKARLLKWGDNNKHALWFGYTQQSHWQVGNPDSTRPVRETNYQPELIYAMRPDGYEFGDWRYRLFTVALQHESNWRSGETSRSWTRLYAQFGFEGKLVEPNDLAILVRPWVRVLESTDRDDNPDITDFLGHGDVTAVWRGCDHTLSMMVRGNVQTRKGAVQATWSTRPLVGPVRLYAQFFSGYGESLIDYNWRQTTFGVGVAVNDLLDDPRRPRPCGRV